MIFRSFRERRPFPGQDPFVVPFEGSLLLISSARDDREIVIKRFDSLDRMDRNQTTVIWRPYRRCDHGLQIWAPELHQINGRWYVYYAASDGRNRNHRMYVLAADHPLGPYEEIGWIGDPGHDTWAIDLTVLEHHERLYAVWSGWEGPDDGFPQNLYIAPMSNPWTISGERRLISRPEYDWEQTVAAVNEGPQILRHPSGDKLFIVYSADASWTHAYKMAVLEFTGGDVTDPASWVKVPRPLLVGGGHGCGVETPDGPYFVYHRKTTPSLGWGDREITAQPLGWDAAGYPVLGLRAAGGAAAESAPRPAPDGDRVLAPAAMAAPSWT